jgi:hypothetical protein
MTTITPPTPLLSLTNELVKKGGTNNNLYFLHVDFPHVITTETVDDPTPRLTSVSDEWKSSPSAQIQGHRYLEPPILGVQRRLRVKRRHPDSQNPHL